MMLKTVFRFLAYFLSVPVFVLLVCSWPYAGLVIAVSAAIIYWGLLCWNMASGRGPIA